MFIYIQYNEIYNHILLFLYFYIIILLSFPLLNNKLCVYLCDILHSKTRKVA
jgi:hypothetical protein